MAAARETTAHISRASWGKRLPSPMAVVILSLPGTSPWSEQPGAPRWEALAVAVAVAARRTPSPLVEKAEKAEQAEVAAREASAE